jgi:undecaprenyl-diphosphatase
MTLQSVDTQLLLLINHGTANPLFDVLMPLLSYQGYLLVVPFLFYILISGFMKKDATGGNQLIKAIVAIVIACAAVYLADLTEHLLKDAIARIRPCRAVEGIRLILPCPKSFSMPSGHAMSSFAFAVPLFYLARTHLSRGWRIFPVILAALIAFSRPYLGVHYPTDILAGAVLGTMIGLMPAMMYEMVAGFLRKQKKKAQN